MTRPLPVGAPPCPKAGHTATAGFRVSRDGRYGRAPTSRRQRYRCTAPGGTFHRFTPPLPREAARGDVCPTCDTHVAEHAGPVVSRDYRHRLHLVADALVAVGRGVSYSLASQRARVAAGRNLMNGDGAGGLVAEWVDVWAPVVIAALAETAQPETLVLDGTDFNWTNRRTGTQRREFAVQIAYGYTADGVRRVWGVRAAPTAQAEDYAALLHDLHLPAPPRSIVIDDDKAIQAALRQVWPPGTADAPVVFLCEHHLRERVIAVLRKDNAHAGKGRWMRRLDTAFRRDEGWEEFSEVAAELGATADWVRTNGPAVAAQVAVRHELPAHRSNAGAEAAAARLRNLLEQRSFALRNARRTNLLLGLVRLHLNNLDDADTYHRIMREHAEACQGRAPQPQRTGRDTYVPGVKRAQPSLRLPQEVTTPSPTSARGGAGKPARGPGVDARSPRAPRAARQLPQASPRPRRTGRSNPP